jgi:serine protease Do
MMIPSMSRSPAPLLVSVGLVLAASASPLAAQKSETIARVATRAAAGDSAGIRLRRLERTIDSLKRIFDDEELGPERRFRVRQQIDERIAEYTAVQMAASPRKSERNVYIRRAAPGVAFESLAREGAMTLPHIAQGAMAGWIGIVVGDAPTQIRVESNEVFMRYLFYPQILSVDPASPAQRAGLAPGDTLMAYNGRDVRADEISMTRLLVPKTTVRVRVRRDGRVRDLPVVVAEAPPRIRKRREEEIRVAGERWREMPPMPMRRPGAMTPPARVYPPPAPPVGVGSVLAPVPPVFSFDGLAGARFLTLSESMKRNLGLPSGVLVTTVPFGSPAAQSGLEEGDVIIRVGQEPVATERDLRDLVARAVDEGERAVAIEIRRGKDRRTLTLRWRAN